MSVIVAKQDAVYCKVEADPGVLMELQDRFTFAVPGAHFMPAFKSGHWDGKLKLFSPFGRKLYIGLIPYVKAYCEQNGEIFVDQVTPRQWLSAEETLELALFIQNLNLSVHGEAIGVREYQYESIVESLKRRRMLLLSPTASGKSLVLYVLVRWYSAQNKKQLIVVPTTSLVEQLYTDFEDYASNTDWSIADHCTRIYSGKLKEDRLVTISTWQSLYKLPKEYFAQFDVVFGDEAHLFQAKSLTAILSQCINAYYRIGTTGTLDNTKTHRMVLEGLFGEIYKATTTKELMDANQLAALKIVCLQLMYPDAERKMTKKFTYQEEIDWLIAYEPRNKFIRNLVVDQSGNTLVLFNYVEKHGKVLYEMIQERVAEGRKVFFVHGGVETEDREQVRAITETEQDAIIVASLGTFSQGINIRRLHNIVFASPTKSRIRNLQSIGRGLRTGEGKTICKLYDIGDNLQWKSRKNHTLNHLVERVKLYAEEGFEYKLVSIPLGSA